FMEKLLLEACLEVMKTDALVGIQDMGAAGLTCSTTEMGSRGGAGIEIDVARVPQRESGMTPYEIMLSESQERMLLVVKKGREAEVETIFDKWDLHAAHIGEVTTDGLMRVKDHGTVVAEIANTFLVDEAPVYDRPTKRPAYIDEIRSLDIPITGGNVSLYNETDGKAIYPTPIIGVVGLIEDASRVLTRAFRESGDAVILLGEDHGELGGSEYLKVIHGLVRGDAPVL